MRHYIFYFFLFFLALYFVACSEESEIEAGKSAFALHGELEDCLADSVNIYETDGFAYHQIKSTPLIKSGSSATFRFSGKVPQKGFYLIGTSLNNLKSAVAGETHEYTDMYPGMAKSARDEGFDEIADWFETLAKAERSHANKFQKALDALAANV